MQKQKTSETEELYGELGRAFNFTRSDLGVNRAGFVSHRQRRQLQQGLQESISPLARLLIVCVIVVFISITLVWGSHPCHLPSGAVFEGVWCHLGLSACLLSPLSVILLYLLITYILDMQETQTQKLVGQLTLNIRHTRTGALYYLVCNKEEFGIDEKLYMYAWKKTPYNIYYLPNRKRILSIEEALPE